MTSDRLNREEFFARLAPLGENELRKALWTLYWRGGPAVRERIEAVTAVGGTLQVRTVATAAPVDAAALLAEVREFAALARKGAYLARSREVSPKERTRWRFTFRRLAAGAQDALAHDVETAGNAVATLVELAHETHGTDYFRSEDPVEAARFVVSDVVEALWSRMRAVHGVDGMLARATGQLVRWESAHGWTRRGEGWVSARERPLAHVLAGLMVAPESWNAAARYYLEALEGPAGAGRHAASDLAEWRALLVEHLIGSDDELVARIVSRRAHEPGPERSDR